MFTNFAFQAASHVVNNLGRCGMLAAQFALNSARREAESCGRLSFTESYDLGHLIEVGEIHRAFEILSNAWDDHFRNIRRSIRRAEYFETAMSCAFGF